MSGRDFAVFNVFNRNAEMPEFMKSPEFQDGALKILSMLHKQNSLQTTKDKNAWPSLKFKIDRSKFEKLKNIRELFNKWWSDCYLEYKKLKHPIGSVDDDPKFWAKLIFDKCEESTLKNNDCFFIIEVNNGCCSNDSCPLTLYMNMLVEHINKF